MPRLIGILGGTFDPIHYGHLRPALEVRQGLELDEVRVIPLRDPPHRESPAVGAKQRLRMVHLALEGQAGFVADDRELRRTGPSYTLDTLRSLTAELGDRERICVLLGADAFADFPDWHEPAEILRLAHLIVMHRPGVAVPETAQLQALVRPNRSDDPSRLREIRSGLILFFAVTPLAISATAIRTMIAAGESPRFLLPDPVLEYIGREGLYR